MYEVARYIYNRSGDYLREMMWKTAMGAKLWASEQRAMCLCIITGLVAYLIVIDDYRGRQLYTTLNTKNRYAVELLLHHGGEMDQEYISQCYEDIGEEDFSSLWVFKE